VTTEALKRPHDRQVPATRWTPAIIHLMPVGSMTGKLIVTMRSSASS